MYKIKPAKTVNELSYRLPATEAKGFMKCRTPTSIKLSHL